MRNKLKGKGASVSPSMGLKTGSKNRTGLVWTMLQGAVWSATRRSQGARPKKTFLVQAKREAHILHYLRHPNLPILIGTDFWRHPYIIVLPLYEVDGSPLNL